MLEKEIKIFNLGTAEEIEKILIDKGCQFVKLEEQTNWIFKYKNKSIRLRKILSLIDRSITYEHTTKSIVERTEKHKIQNERTIIINSDVFEKLIINYNKEKLLYIPILVGNKLRKSFKLNNFLYEIDKWNSRFICPYTYLEVEAINPEMNLDEGIKQILNENQIESIITTTLGIVEIFKYYHNANKFFDLFSKCNIIKDDIWCVDRFIKIIDKELNIKGLIQTGVEL